MPTCAYFNYVFTNGTRVPVWSPPDIAGGSCEWADGLMLTRDEYAQNTQRNTALDQRIAALETRLAAAEASPLSISTQDALAVSGAIASLWLLAWAIRQVRRALD